MCLDGAVVTSWSLTQEVTEWQVRVLLHLGKTPLESIATFLVSLSVAVNDS